MLFIGTNTGKDGATNVARNRGTTINYVVVAVVGVVTLWETKGNKCLMYWTTDLLEVGESINAQWHIVLAILHVIQL